MNIDNKISKEELEIADQRTGNVTKLRKHDHIKNIPPMRFDQIINNAPNPRQNILHPILPEQGWMLIYAESGLGKTLFSLNLAYAIASGGNFLKYIASQPKRVLYIDGEMSYRSMHERIMAIVKEQGELEFPENFYLFTPDKMLPPDSPEGAIPEPLPKISTQQGQEFYNYIIDKYKIDVIFFDNYSVLSTGDDSSPEDWYPVQDWFTHLKAIGKSVALIHHSGKNGEYRGTSRMIDTADTAISLIRVDQHLPDGETILTKKFNVKYKKHRNFDGEDAQTYEVIFNDCKWGYQGIEVTLMDKVVDCVNANMSQREIAHELLVSQTSVNRMIKKARKAGRIKE